MVKIKIDARGITEIPADCVVNAANEGLWEGGGVCGAIFSAAGAQELAEECRKIGHCDTGSAVITRAGRLRAQYIIHAVGPRYIDGHHGEPEQLYDCYKKSLELVKEHGCHSVVFPVISAGIFGYPKDGAWRKAIQACVDFGKKNPDYEIEAIFAVPGFGMRELGQKTLKEILAEEHPGHAEPHSHEPVSEQRRKIFEDTMAMIGERAGLTESVNYSIANSRIYYEDDYPKFHREAVGETIHVSRERSFEAAKRLRKAFPGQKIAVMNFANAFHPGGGVTRGASAQEESLCRCSTLYPVLCGQPGYYDYHKKKNDPRASDALIYSPEIVVVKTDTESPERTPDSEWFSVDVLTIAAPDLREKSNMYAALVGGGAIMTKAEQFGYHVRRAMHMLTVAAANNAEVLVLGAFGCGAFLNDPQTVADAYRTALAIFPKVFAHIEFAVYSRNNSNYEIFRDTLTIRQHTEK